MREEQVHMANGRPALFTSALKSQPERARFGVQVWLDTWQRRCSPASVRDRLVHLEAMR